MLSWGPEWLIAAQTMNLIDDLRQEKHGSYPAWCETMDQVPVIISGNDDVSGNDDGSEESGTSWQAEVSAKVLEI